MKAKTIILTLTLTTCIIGNFNSVFSSNSGEGNAPQFKSIALVSTMIGKIVQPVLPLLDAAPFNKRTNSIAPLIISEEMKIINTYRESVANSLKAQFNCDVLYGEKLVVKQEYNDITAKFNYPNNLKIDNDFFSDIIIPKDEKNLFPFEKGDVLDFMKDEEKVKTQVAEICAKLGTDLIAVSYSSLAVVSFGWFGASGKIVLQTNFFLFDKDGNLIVKGSKSSEPLKTVGDEIMDYTAQLKSLPEILMPMLSKAAKKMKISK